MDWVLILMLTTFTLLIAFLIWNAISTKRHRAGATSGVGGLSDPLSGTTKGMRHPDAMRSDMEQASSASASDRGLHSSLPK